MNIAIYIAIYMGIAIYCVLSQFYLKNMVAWHQTAYTVMQKIKLIKETGLP